MATPSLHPSSNPFRDPNRTPGVTPQPTGSSLNPFLSSNERISPQATGASSQYFTPEHTGAEAGRITTQNTGSGAFLSPQATGALNSQDTGSSQWRGSGSYTAPADEFAVLSVSDSQPTYAPPPGPPPSHSLSPNPSATLSPSSSMPNLSAGTPRPQSPPQSVFAPPPGSPPPPRSTYAPPPGPPPGRPTSAPGPVASPRAPSPTPTLSEPPPPYTPAADVRHGEIPLETGPRRAYAPEWHPDGRTWRNESAIGPTSPTSPSGGSGDGDRPGQDYYAQPSSSSGSGSGSGRPSAGGSSWNIGGSSWSTGSSSWSAYPGRTGGGGGGGGTLLRPPPRHPSGSQAASTPSLGRSNTTISRPTPGPPTTVPTPGRALLNQGRVLAYPAGYECNKCHLTGYQAYDPSNSCQQCWSLFGQPYEGILTFAPWDQPESITSDEQNLQRPLPATNFRPQQSRPQPNTSNRPISHPPPRPTPPGSLPVAGWSSQGSSLRPSATISYSRRPPPGSLVVRPGDPRIGGRICWKCSGDGWQYKTMGLETKTCSACNGLGRLF
ncbi:hypothetical protein FRC12_000535 [Ceratobasidium sp. 428]|nr:hypothetical protein FRC12_000535 [Ceratobasidium sp. 428]